MLHNRRTAGKQVCTRQKESTYSTVQYSGTVQYSTVQWCSTVQYSTVKDAKSHTNEFSGPCVGIIGNGKRHDDDDDDDDDDVR